MGGDRAYTPHGEHELRIRPEAEVWRNRRIKSDQLADPSDRASLLRQPRLAQAVIDAIVHFARERSLKRLTALDLCDRPCRARQGEIALKRFNRLRVPTPKAPTTR